MENQKPKQADQVNSIEDVIAIAKPTQEEMDLIKYSGTNVRMQGAKWHLLAQMICDVFNEGWAPDWSNYGERKWYPFFDMDAGVGFSRSYYGSWLTGTAVGSRLCFKTEALSDMAARKFPDVYKGLLNK